MVSFIDARRATFGGCATGINPVKHGYQRSQGSPVSDVRGGTANWGLGVIFQEKVRPFAKTDLLALADDMQRIVIPGLKPFAKLTLSLLPVFRMG